MVFLYRVARIWVPIAIAVTAACGLAYVGAQQVYRMSANDPQIQMAEDAATALKTAQSPASVAGSPTIDIATSLAPFLVVYMRPSSGGAGPVEPVASTGQLDGTAPTPPIGVLEASSKPGGNRVTWQPRPDVRIAAVVVPAAGPAGRYYVLAGRSLREVERRESDLTTMAALALLAALVGSLIAVLVIEWLGAALRRSA
jgi:hypothetical protein